MTDDPVTKCMTEIMRQAFWAVAYHETELAYSHAKLGAAKALMLRAGLDLPLADIEAEMRAKADEHPDDNA